MAPLRKSRIDGGVEEREERPRPQAWTLGGNQSQLDCKVAGQDVKRLSTS
jgi:hypothetical protein